MLHPGVLLFYGILPPRLPPIWNTDSGATYEIQALLFQSMVAAAGRILLVPELLASLYTSVKYILCVLYVLMHLTSTMSNMN